MSEMTVDEHLMKQDETARLATIQPVNGKPEIVKVTPWSQTPGCSCRSGLEIPKTLIGSVDPTGQIHYCCGRQLKVVEITFNKDAQVSVADVFNQLHSLSTQISPPPAKTRPNVALAKLDGRQQVSFSPPIDNPPCPKVVWQIDNWIPWPNAQMLSAGDSRIGNIYITVDEMGCVGFSANVLTYKPPRKVGGELFFHSINNDVNLGSIELSWSPVMTDYNRVYSWVFSSFVSSGGDCLNPGPGTQQIDVTNLIRLGGTVNFSYYDHGP